MSPSISVGIAIYPLHGKTLPALLHASDAALYAAKDAGLIRARIAATAKDAVMQRVLDDSTNV